MENINFRGIPTSLFLNGPKVGIVTDPQDQQSTVGISTFTGIATATFPGASLDGGSLQLNWYFDGQRILDTSEDSSSNAKIVGFNSATGTGSTITIGGLVPTDNGKEIYFEADYIASAYSQPTGSTVTAGTARSTGNAYNEPLRSASTFLEVQSSIVITKQPENKLVANGLESKFSVEATAPTSISYQWQLNGVDLIDGTRTVSANILGGTGDPVCISVIDQSSQAPSVINSSWTNFRANFPKRPFYLLSVAGYSNPIESLKVPQSFINDPNAFLIEVNRDNGVVSNRSDWFALCNLSTRPSGSVISLQVDTSGSMTRSSVQSSINLFVEKCTNAGLDLKNSDIANESENWVIGHDQVFNVTNTGEEKIIKITNDQNSEVVNLDLDRDAAYDLFEPNTVYTLVPGENITVKLITSGAGGGFSQSRNISGGSGGLSTGTFVLIKDTTYKLVVGSAGGTGTPGVPGGGGSLTGGGGGGYTGLFEESINHANSIIIAGGGGGGANDPAVGGAGGGLEGGDALNYPLKGGEGGSQSAGGSIPAGGGSAGSELQGGTGYAGGGGGYYGGGGGSPVALLSDGAGGGGSGYIGGVISGTTTAGAGAGAAKDGSFTIELSGSSVNTTLTVSGSNTPNLTVIGDANIFGILKCKLTASNVINSPLFSRSTGLTIVPVRSMIGIETYDYSNNTATIIFKNLDNGEVTIDYANYPGNDVAVYASEQDLSVEVDLYGGRGQNGGSAGGFGRFELGMTKNDEYVISGLFTSINAPFFYRKSTLIAVAGAGGWGNGAGSGGGPDQRGTAGQGLNSGEGGRQVASLVFPGIFGRLVLGIITPIGNDTIQQELNAGGVTIPCPRGVYWRNQGKSPCDLLGNIQFRTPDGTILENTATISRGYKSGYNIIQTGGAGGSYPGGVGAAGGSGARSGGVSGGGGSGFTDGSMNLLESITGNSGGNSKVVFRLARTGSFEHVFENPAKITRSLTTTGIIVAAQEFGTQGGFNVQGQLNVKHYLFTFDQEYSNLTWTLVSNLTAAGGRVDPGMFAQLSQKVNATQWRVWFARGGSVIGANTFVREFRVNAVI